MGFVLPRSKLRKPPFNSVATYNLATYNLATYNLATSRTAIAQPRFPPNSANRSASTTAPISHWPNAYSQPRSPHLARNPNISYTAQCFNFLQHNNKSNFSDSGICAGWRRSGHYSGLKRTTHQLTLGLGLCDCAAAY